MAVIGFGTPWQLSNETTPVLDAQEGSLDVRSWPVTSLAAVQANVGFSNRPFRVKRFQTIHCYSVDVAHGLVLLFGIGTKVLPSWDSKTR